MDQVKAPCLFLMGLKDKRVPVQDGFQYLYALQGRGVTAEAIAFPEDSHPLDKPRTEFESFVAIAQWMKEHMGLRGE